MPITRIRSVRPEFFDDETLLELPRDVRMTFLGLQAYADDYGREKSNSVIAKGAIWPLDEDITPEVMDQHMLQLEAAGFIELYTVAKRSYYQIVDWTDWQRVDRPSKSTRIPPPPEPSRAPREPLAEEGRGEGERERERGEGEREPSRASPHFDLPNEAPSPFCRNHPEGTDRPCRACGTARLRHEMFVQQAKVQFAEVDPEPYE